MPTPWTPTNVTQAALGMFHVEIQPPGSKLVDVTYFRDVPTQVMSYSFADPFGPAAAQIAFPQITILDDVGNGELSWLQDFANVTIYINTGQMVAHTDFATANGYRHVVWEGFLASWEWQSDESTSALTIQCQGGMFQADKYVQKPFYPARPWAYENLITRCFDHRERPALRTKPLKIEWPAGWSKVMTAPSASTPSYLQPVGVTPGQKITGFFGRDTGSWDKSLTGYVQSLLSLMYDDRGQQWTMRLDNNRQPVLYVRQMFGITPKYSVYAGQPGVSISLSRDLTQFANVIYGEGTDQNGVEWDRQVVDTATGLTDYEPMAYDPEIWPYLNNARFNPNKMTVEANIKYNNGFDERQALASAAKTLKVDMDPGLAGTLTLKVSPTGGPKEYIRAGESIVVYFVVGTGSRGVIFNIAEADHNVAEGTVECKIDSKFRDLLTLEEVLVRTRDPLTPVTMLQINKRSVLIQDQLAPWNYSKGSGYMPLGALPFYKDMSSTDRFPYTAHAKKYPPKKYPHFYIKCHANGTRHQRWSTFGIRMSEKGTIRITQFAAYDKDGNILKIPFHLGIYNVYVDANDMPYDANGPSPFIPNAFESVDVNGLTIPADTPGATTLPQQQMVIGWGHSNQPAGYSPGEKTAGDPVTGMLTDETPWTFDLNSRFGNGAPPANEVESIITMYGIVYAEYHDYVYFTGRLYRQEPGV